MTAEIIDVATGEVMEAMSAELARRLTTEARNELKSSADHFNQAWSLIEEAVKGGGHLALGYRSPGDYLHAEFDGVLSGLDVAARRVAVRSMSSWGLSTRAIAPVVGVSQSQTDRDKQVTHDGSPTPETPSPGLTSPAKVTGIDGKDYPHPEPKAAPVTDPSTADPKAKAINVTWDQLLKATFAGGWIDEELVIHKAVTADEAAQFLDRLTKSTRVLARVKQLLTERKATS